MKTSKMLLATGAFLFLAGPLIAQANLIWDWAGDCQEVRPASLPLCKHATLHVVTTDAYIPGELFFLNFPPGSNFPKPTPPVLLQFLYFDNNITIDLADLLLSDPGTLLLPDIAVGSSLPADGAKMTTATLFRSDAQGNWRLVGEGFDPTCADHHFCAYDARGDNGVWTRVAEPSTLLLIGVGLVGLVFSRRLRTKSGSCRLERRTPGADL